MSSPTENRLHFEGVLDKAGKRFFEGFRKRWFILDGQELTYFKAPETTEENYLGTIDFSQVKSVNPVKMVNNGFQIITKNRTYTFSAQTSENLTEWVSVLRQAMQLKSFESSKKRLSAQDSIDSQYETVITRPNRSFSSTSDQSFEGDDLDNDLYSSVGDSSVKPAVKGPGEYSLVGTASLPRGSTKPSSDEQMYELVGSRQASRSNSAPPTYEVAQAAKKKAHVPTPVKENAQEEPDSAMYDCVQGRQEEGDLYGLVRATDVQEQSKVDSGDSTPQPTEPKEPPSAVADLYSVPDISRKQKPGKPDPRGLSMISESEEAVPSVPVRNPEKIAPPLPPPLENHEEAVAIYEIKRILEEAKREEEENQRNEESNEKGEEEEVVIDDKVSAFQQLKEFLQRLDSTEME